MFGIYFLIWILFWFVADMAILAMWPDLSDESFLTNMFNLYVLFVAFWVIFKMKIVKRPINVATLIIFVVGAYMLAGLYAGILYEEQQDQGRVMGPLLISLYLALAYNPKKLEESNSVPKQGTEVEQFPVKEEPNKE